MEGIRIWKEERQKERKAEKSEEGRRKRKFGKQVSPKRMYLLTNVQSAFILTLKAARNSPTQCSRVLLEKLTFPKVLEKYPHFMVPDGQYRAEKIPTIPRPPSLFH